MGILVYNKYKVVLVECEDKRELVDFYLENYFKISHQALTLRLKLDKHINNKRYKKLKEVNFIKEARKYGYSIELYTKPITEEDLIVESDYA